MGYPEREVTAGPITQPFERIFARTSWALALAGGSVGGRRAGLTVTPLPITPLLLPSALAPAVTGPIAPAGLDPSPSRRRGPAGRAAIAALRMRWSITPFTPFEQTLPEPADGPCPLIGDQDMMQWRWAPGRSCSRRSSLGAKRQLGSEALYAPRLELLPP